MEARQNMKIRVPNEVTFVEETHVYTVGDLIVPSVTTVLKAQDTDTDYSHVPPQVLQRASEIGTEVHKYAENWAVTGEVDAYSDDRSVNAYLTPFYEFVKLGALEVDYAELRLYHPNLWFAGTVDIVGRLWGEPCIIDVKTTNKLDRKYVELQTAGYEILVGFWSEEIDRFSRYALHLTKDGRWSLEKFDDPFAEGDFLRALGGYNA